MFHGHILEIRKLHPRPDHEVLRQAGYIGILQALFRGSALEVCHGGEEEGHVCGREDELVACDAREDGAVFGGGVYVAYEEFVPFCRGGAEDR